MKRTCEWLEDPGQGCGGAPPFGDAATGSNIPAAFRSRAAPASSGDSAWQVAGGWDPAWAPAQPVQVLPLMARFQQMWEQMGRHQAWSEGWSAEEPQDATHAADSSGAQPGSERDRWTGHIKSFNEGGGFGFIDCPDAKARYGMDVWLHRNQMHGFQVGDRVRFSIARNTSGQPQARQVVREEDEARYKAKRQRQQEQQAELLRQKHMAHNNSAGPAAGGLMDEESAKKFQASLRRSNS